MLATAQPEVKNKTMKGKWPEIKKRLKAKGMLKPMANIDECNIEMDIPAFPQDIISSEIAECGFFNWNFQFMNKQINGEKIVNNTDNDDDSGTALQQNRQNHIGFRGYRKKYRRAHGKKKFQAIRLRQYSKRPGFLLVARCAPIVEVLNQSVQNLLSWRLIASIRVSWKEQQHMKKGKHFRTIVFTKGDPLQAIRFYSQLSVKRAQTLQIQVRVFRIARTNIISSITFDHQPGRVCLRSKGENIFVHREALGISSRVFREQIELGLGENVENSIQIKEKFTPSLVRQAFRTIFSHNKIECFNVPELLEFAAVYEIGQLSGIIEDSMIKRYKCKHFPLQRKLELAYKYGLHEMINTFVQRMETIEAIEGKLEKNKRMHAEFKGALERKLKKMKIEKEKLQAEKREIRKKSKEKKKQQVRKKYEKDGKKREADEAIQNDVPKGIEKLKIQP